MPASIDAMPDVCRDRKKTGEVFSRNQHVVPASIFAKRHYGHKELQRRRSKSLNLLALLAIGLHAGFWAGPSSNSRPRILEEIMKR